MVWNKYNNIFHLKNFNQFSQRLFLSLFFTATNLANTLIAINFCKSFQGLITQFIIISMLTLVLSTSLWERSGQKFTRLSSKEYLIILISVIMSYYILNFKNLLVIPDINLLILIISNLFLAGGNIIHQYFVSKSKIVESFSLYIVKFFLVIFSVFYFYLFKGANYQNFLLFNMCLNLIIFFISRILISKYSLLEIHNKFDFTSLFITIFDFFKNQTWLIFLIFFSTMLTTTYIFLLRQLLSPISLILSSYRTSLFDSSKNKKYLSSMPYKNLKFPSGLVVLVVLLLSSISFSSISESIYFIIAWLLLVFAQDFRAYFSRIIQIKKETLFLYIIVSIAPIILITLYSNYFYKLHASLLIFTSSLSEFLIVYYCVSKKSK